jgi:hypothetical protein
MGNAVSLFPQKAPFLADDFAGKGAWIILSLSGFSQRGKSGRADFTEMILIYEEKSAGRTKLWRV